MAKRDNRKSGTTFYCFSPPVMIATFTIEMLLAAYTIWRYKLNVLGRLVLVILASLALFQLCEYHVCGGWGVRAREWSRLGYVAITLLPALGLHTLHVLAGKTSRKLVVAGYTSMVAFVGYFLLAPDAFTGYACTGNYVIFQVNQHATWMYSLYYYGWLLTAIVLGAIWANKFQAAGEEAHAKLQAVRGLIIGYLVFLVPTTIANSIKPETRSGIPSIMCGFAVIFAFILTFYILPRLAEQRHSQHVDNTQ